MRAPLSRQACFYRDFGYEYPPGPLPFLVLPFGHVSESMYLAVYVSQMLIVDAVVLAVLQRRRTPGRLAAPRL